MQKPKRCLFVYVAASLGQTLQTATHIKYFFYIPIIPANQLEFRRQVKYVKKKTGPLRKGLSALCLPIQLFIHSTRMSRRARFFSINPNKLYEDRPLLTSPPVREQTPHWYWFNPSLCSIKIAQILTLQRCVISPQLREIDELITLV